MSGAVVGHDQESGGKLHGGDKAGPDAVGEGNVVWKIVGAGFGEADADVVEVAPESDLEVAAAPGGGKIVIAARKRGVGGSEMAAEGVAGVDANVAAGHVGGDDGGAAKHELRGVGAVLAAALVAEGPVGLDDIGDVGVEGDVLGNAVGTAGVGFEAEGLRGVVAAGDITLEHLVGAWRAAWT